MDSNQQPQGLSRRTMLESLGAATGGAALFQLLHELGAPSRASAQTPLKLEAGIGQGRHVVILGGGVGGLAAAYELLRSNSGYRVTVLEASSILGGRSLTLRPGDVLKEDKFPAQKCTFQEEPDQPYQPYLNAGPGRLPSAHTAILDYCRQLNVPLEIYVMESRSNLVAHQPGLGASLVNRHIANDARGWIAQELYALVDEVPGLDRTQRAAFRELLAKFGALGDNGMYVRHDAYANSTRSGYKELPGVEPGTSVDPISLSDVLKSRFWETSFYQPADFLWQASLMQPVGGMDKIVDGFAKALGGMPNNRVITSAKVTSIARVNGKFRIVYDQQGKEQRLDADQCISNIPIPLLKDRLQLGGFEPGFRQALQAVFNTPNFLGPTCKVGWQAPRALWQQPDPAANRVVPIYGGISWTSHPMTQMWYPSDNFHAELGVLTGAYNFSSNAIRWGNLPPEARIQEARQGAHQLAGEAFAKGLQHGITIAWQNMEFLRGGWAQWQTVRNGTEVYNKLIEGDNGFYIVGDQASQLPGWQEGAVLAARHVAQMMAQPGYVPPKVRAVPDSRKLVEGF